MAIPVLRSNQRRVEIEPMSVALKPNTLIGGLTLTQVIGRGGFGITYRAVDESSRKVYAVKEYLPEGMSVRSRSDHVSALSGQGATYARGLEAFMSEANILKDLPKTRGLVRVRGAFEKFGTAYCVMEYIEGDSLDRMADRLIARIGHVPADLVSELAVSVCWALAALHGQRLIHRDVKPANIMLRKTGEPVLIDFGAARRLSRRGAKETIFTRRYAALEQFPPEMNAFGRSFEEGPWSDIYSLCVVLYELVAKDTPPDAPERAAALLEGRADPFRPLGSDPALLSKYPATLLEAIDFGCGLMPKERPQSAQAFARLIDAAMWDALAATETSGTRDPTGPSTAPPVPSARPSRRAVFLLLAALGGGAAYLYYQSLSAEVF